MSTPALYHAESVTPDLEKNVDMGPTVTRVQTSECGRFVNLGGHNFDREEFSKALMPSGGEFRAGTYAAPTRKFGNPAPLGLASFSICIMTLSLYNIGARNVTDKSVLAGGFIFMGGLLQILVSMWCIIVENTFAATVFGCFGGYTMGNGLTLIGAIGITSSYKSVHEFEDALGIYNMVWAVFAFLIWTLTLKSTWGLCSMFFFIWSLIFTMALGNLLRSQVVTKVSGVFGLICSIIGFYNMYVGMSNHENSYFVIKPKYMPGTVSFNH